MAFLVICVGITILQMSKVDPMEFKKLDRRSTILFQAARQQTEAVDEKSVEEPGIDTLRGSFGTVGSIIRARSAYRMSQSTRGSVHSSRLAPPSSPIDVERGDSKTSSSNFSHYGGMQRHQLFDPPVPHLDVPTSDTLSLASQPSARKPTIKFGEQDVIHSYHRGTTGKDGMATHELREVPSPLSSPGPPGKPTPSSPEDSTDGRLRQQQSLGTAHLGSPSRFDPEVHGLRSAPPGVGVAEDVYHDPFKGLPATAVLPSFSSADDDTTARHHHRRTYSRGGSRDYPKGDRVDDAEERVSLWNPQRDNNEEVDVAASPDSPYGTVRLVGSSGPRHF